MKNNIFIIFLLVICMISCQNPKGNNQVENTSASIDSVVKKSFFGFFNDKEVSQYRLSNDKGTEITVINYGGIITSLKTKNRDGKSEDIVLGYDSLAHYVNSSPYFGAIVGRYGNRIANGKFTLDGKTYSLAQNNNGQHLHGGVKGFDKVYWDVHGEPVSDGAALKLTYASPDGEEGYPGKLTIEVIYHLTTSNELKIQYKATTDSPTIVNLTQHSYFNLSGDASQSILQHELTIPADKFIPVDEVLIPTGKLQDVSNTPFDFRSAIAIGSRIEENDQQLTVGGGYDHCWVLTDASKTLHPAAILYHPISGRLMEVFTTEPGIQFYSGNFLDGTLTGKNGIPYQHRAGLCLETQHFPDSPNQAHFPSVVLRPGETYETTTVYKFSIR
jgi:aldose 1-epimerase